MFNEFVLVELVLFSGGLNCDTMDLSLITEGVSSITEGFMVVTARLGCGAGGFFRIGAPCDITDVELFCGGCGARYGFGATVL